MTALGAGTALSTLHTLERAVLVLHGHKHYATARLLRGMVRGHGDVLVVSAGSAGTAERWSPTANGDAARLWPSFNAIELEGDRLDIDVVSFGYKGSSAAKVARRALVRARRQGATWSIDPVRDEPPRRGRATRPLASSSPSTPPPATGTPAGCAERSPRTFASTDRAPRRSSGSAS